MNISYEGIGAQVVTFPMGTCKAGQVCKIGTTGSVDKCSVGDKFCGVMLAGEADMAAVQVEGFIRIGYAGSKPSCGYVNLAADGSGKVIVDSDGREYLVVAVNTADMSVIIKL